MKTALCNICILVLLTGCNAADKPAAADPSSGTKPATADSRVSLTEKSVSLSGTAAGVITGSAIIKADLNLEEGVVTAEAELTETVESTGPTAGTAGSKAEIEVISPVEKKKFKRFTPDPEDVTRKTAVEKLEKGPGLTATYRRVTQPTE